MNRTDRMLGIVLELQSRGHQRAEDLVATFEVSKRTIYRDIRDLLEPSLAFVEAVGARLQAIAPDIRVDTRTNGSGNLMRIYRDTRFSRDKTPYKTAVSALFWQGDGKKTACPAFGFQVDRQGMQLMAGLFAFSKEQLQQYRTAVVDDTLGQALVEAVTTVTQSGSYELNEQHYKRIPRGYDPTHERAEWLLYNALYAHPQHSLPTTDY